MAHLTELQVEKVKSHMMRDENALKIKFKAKNTEFDTISRPHNEVEDYEKMGYSVVRSSARKTTLSRKKDHSVQFEDDVWCMFYKLGFRILNGDEKLVIQWGPNKEDTQQLDVVAVGDDAIFVVECKAAQAFVGHSFKTELNKMEQYMSGVTEALQQIYGSGKRVKFLFASRNYRINDEDIARMANAGIFHLNDNSYNYINNLIKSYKESVIYQFYGLMFKDELINDEIIKIPVLKGKMGERNYYIFSIEPSTLLKIGFVLHRTRVNDSMAPTYQRLLVPSRLKGITKFIDGGGYFPNSIIINFNAANDDLKVKFSPIKSEKDSQSEFGFLRIPNAYGIAYIIDGQHRVYGYAQSQHKEDSTIPVVAFEGMESEEQLKIFMEINDNQKAVSPSLRLDLEEDLYWKSARLDSRMKALRSSCIKALAANSNYVLYNKISVGEDPSMLAFKPFDTALGRSGLIPKATSTQWTGDTDVCIYNTNETDIDKAMKDSRTRITKFIDGGYAIADSIMTEEVKQDYLFSNRATFAFIALLGSLHTYLIKINAINPLSAISERITAIEPYIQHLSNSLNSLSDEENRTIKGVLGQGADTFWLRSFQNIINKQFPEYAPEELVEWKETQDQSLQQEGADRKKDIRKQLRILLFDRLEMVFGAKWLNNVAILKNAVEGRIIKEYGDSDDFDMSEYDWRDYLEISEYREVIDKNFSYQEFEEVFAINIGLAFKSKKDKLNWMTLISEPKGKKSSALTRSDLNRLELINTHLANFIDVE